MLDSVLVARDRFLKPDGALYPSHARLFVAPIWTHNGQNHRLRDYDNAMAGWGEFVEDMHSEYGVDMKVLSASFQKEQRDYFLCTAQWTDVHPDQLMGPPQVVKEFDLKAVVRGEEGRLSLAKISITMRPWSVTLNQRCTMPADAGRDQGGPGPAVRPHVRCAGPGGCPLRVVRRDLPGQRRAPRLPDGHPQHGAGRHGRHALGAAVLLLREGRLPGQPGGQGERGERGAARQKGF